MIFSWFERTTSHIETETRFRLLFVASSKEYWTMGYRLIQQYYVKD